ASLEGLEAIRAELDRDTSGFQYATAWQDLWMLQRPEATGILLRVLDKPTIFDNLGKPNDYLPCRIWMTRKRAFVDILQQRLASTMDKGKGYSSWYQKGTPTEGDRVAEMLADWAKRGHADIAMEYLFDEPEESRAAKREVLSKWVEEQYALAI